MARPVVECYSSKKGVGRFYEKIFTDPLAFIIRAYGR